MKRYAPCVHCTIVYNSQDMEAAQVSIRGWMDKEDAVYINNGILLSYKIKEWYLVMWDNMGREYYAASEISQTKKDKYCMNSLTCGI